MSDEWKNDYRRLEPDYERLREEVEYAITDALAEAGMKPHSVTTRVKTIDSLADKAKRKGYDTPLEQTPDVVGARVVLRFLTELPEVEGILRTLFEVSAAEDKIESQDDPSTFGYMSLHYEATLPSTHTGPRYKGLHEIRFEIQVRTLLMDAWANVSHYLAYKGDSSIPEELRKDFYALSGLFYVADKHFELFFKSATAVQEETEKQPDASAVPLNLDTFVAYLERRFPDRIHLGRDAVGELADELLAFGYKTLGDVEAMLDATSDTFHEYEARYPPSGDDVDEEDPRYADVGVVRLSLKESDSDYATYLAGKWKKLEARFLLETIADDEEDEAPTGPGDET